ncbi:MAG: AMP-binding protein [Proteobacteria bacterium]|nr:AMP-binding protein [Pseudomonadota bacterium]
MSHELIIANLVARRALSDPDRDVLIFEDGGVEEIRTYRQLWQNAQRVAAALQAQGVRQGDRFALLMQNHPEFVEAMIASAILGSVFVPIDPRTRGDKLAYLLRDAGCQGVICGDNALANLLECAAAVPSLRWLFCIGDAAARESSRLPLHSLSEVLARSGVPDLPVATRSDLDPMQILYTSGTTGDPKGIVIRHARFAFVAKQGELVLGYRASDRLYTGLSLTHGNAQFVTLAPGLYMGLRTVISRKFTKSRLWQIVRRYGCTTFSLLGGMVTAIYGEPLRDDDADNPVRFVVSAGMPKAIWEDFAKRFNVQIFEFYGAVEGGMTINPVGEGPIGSCGRVAPGLVAKVVDEQGDEVAPNTPGEILFRPADGSAAAVEYFNNPTASAVKTEGGWLHSGDVVTMDEQGWIFFQYRKGGGLRHNGEFINPAFLEKAIAEHPQVSDVAVFGVPAVSGAPGEMDIVAAVVAADPRQFDPHDLFDWCRKRVEANTVPGFIQVVAELPKTASEKVQPRFLKQMFMEGTTPIYREQVAG